MSLTKNQFAQYVRSFNFKELFNDMGWNNDKTNQPIVVDEVTFRLTGIAEKSGFKILLCSPTEKGSIPDYQTRRLIDTKITKLFQEHLIIFCDEKQQEQIWQLVVRQTGKPAKVTETRYHISQDPELLYQRASGIFFTMDEEEKITIVDVTARIKENFYQNNERVTKKFYERFKKEHTSFLTFIKGLNFKLNKDWYASLMLNRLMFCYFIQKKNFLDNNKNYLRDKLKACQEKKGKGKFYSFYRSFLLVLFHEGLNEPSQKKEIKIEIGRIPYLNGGLFDEHELEKNFEIDIEDKAFEGIFDFFDEYEWHLDTRKEATGKDINPDVIGYIFEKYINDRAQMGAYYTKEDITDYISKNCIIPWLFDETKRNYPKTFAVNEEITVFLNSSGDEYIYDAVKHGVDIPLPKEIEIGIKEIDKRTKWNITATPEAGLPTEIWREVVERRKRYTDVKHKIQNGEVNSIDDFITYNLNIKQFAQDVIENTNDPDFLRTFYKSLTRITILDPTCGSGAFLFAAMNILEPLYYACITRMRGFTEDEDRLNEEKKKTFSNKYKFFRGVLENIQNERHPNLEYFIYKTIILNNLYGVDIMKEAVEIAKLRLFLKLAATIEKADYNKKNLGLEPLPDIDFNIRAGNTLIGFATEEGLRTGSLDFQENEKEVLEQMELVSMAFKRFKEIQLSETNSDYTDFKDAKKDYQNRLDELKNNLNLSFYDVFGDHIRGYNRWFKDYLPFHWFAEFYEIIHDKKGFDIIIGNPPYVNFKKLEYNFKEKNFKCLHCKDLFAITIERSFQIISSNGRNGFIIPLSGMSTGTMVSLKELILKSGRSWNSYYSASDQPASLFNGVRHRLLINLNKVSDKNRKTYSTNFLKWFSEERDFLFKKSIKYEDVSLDIPANSKISIELEKYIFKKINKYNPLANYISRIGKSVYYHNAPVHWGKIFDFVPFYSVGGKQQQSSHLKNLHFPNDTDAAVAICLLNSSLFYWYNWQYSNCRDLSLKDILRIPISIDRIEASRKKTLAILKEKLMGDLKKNSKIYKRVSNNIETRFDSFYPMYSKSIIDEIDKVLAEHYGFTDEELDFIINYDIKYRMGKELGEEG